MPQQNSTSRIFQNRNIAVDLHLVSSTNVNNICLAGHRTVAVINIQTSGTILKRLFCGQTKSVRFTPVKSPFCVRPQKMCILGPTIPQTNLNPTSNIVNQVKFRLC